MVQHIIALIVILSISPYSISQDSAKIDSIFYWQQDSLAFRTIYFNRRISNCESLTMASTFIIDSNDIKINGWVIIEKQNYLIARQIKNGVKNGYELEYKKINDKYVLRAIAVYSQDEMERILFQAFIDPKKLNEEADIIKSLKTYRVWNENQVNPKLISIEYKLISDSKRKEIKYYFDTEFNTTSKSKSTSDRDDSIIRCEFNAYNLMKIPKLISLDNINKTLSEI